MVYKIKEHPSSTDAKEFSARYNAAHSDGENNEGQQSLHQHLISF